LILLFLRNGAVLGEAWCPSQYARASLGPRQERRSIGGSLVKHLGLN
jgi:hypothetical protein